MDFYFTGIIIAVSTFLIIGIFHPIVIKVEYYWGTWRYRRIPTLVYWRIVRTEEACRTWMVSDES